jgi:hypothetical protein
MLALHHLDGMSNNDSVNLRLVNIKENRKMTELEKYMEYLSAANNLNMVKVLCPRYSRQGYYIEHKTLSGCIHRCGSSKEFCVYDDTNSTIKKEFTIDDIQEIIITVSNVSIWIKSNNQI